MGKADVEAFVTLQGGTAADCSASSTETIDGVVYRPSPMPQGAWGGNGDGENPSTMPSAMIQQLNLRAAGTVMRQGLERALGDFVAGGVHGAPVKGVRAAPFRVPHI